MPTVQPDTRSDRLKALDEQAAAEPPLSPYQPPASAVPQPLEAFARRPRRPVAAAGLLYNDTGGVPMPATPPVIHTDPDILGGVPVFAGTRVPVRALVDYLGGGQPLAEFLEDFPSVSREQAVAALRLVAQALAADA